MDNDIQPLEGIATEMFFFVWSTASANLVHLGQIWLCDGYLATCRNLACIWVPDCLNVGLVGFHFSDPEDWVCLWACSDGSHRLVR